MATYNGQVTGGALNLRASASTSSTRLTQIPNRTNIVVSDYGGNASWYCTTYNNYSGFVLKKYVNILSSVATRTCFVTGGSLALRESPSTSATILAYIPNATQLSAQTHNSQWSSVSYNGVSGFVLSQYLSNGYPSLSLGMEGDAVWAMQEKLMDKHYYYGHSDGLFDTRTEWAVKYFQYRNGLTATGVVDQSTMNKLNDANAEIGVYPSGVVNRVIGGPAESAMKMGTSLWANVPFDATNTAQVETIGDSANAPTAIAIAFTTLWENAITPPVICDFAVQKGYRDPNGTQGVTSAFFQGVSGEFDVRYAGTTSGAANIKSYIDKGGLCVVRLTGDPSHNYCSLNGATYVVVYKVDSNNVYLVNSNSGSNAPIPIATWNSASWVKEAHKYGIPE